MWILTKIDKPQPILGVELVVNIVGRFENHFLLHCRVIDVGSEWRTFSNESSGQDRSRVGSSEVRMFSSIYLLG